MKRKRGGEENQGRICELGLQWISSKRAPKEDDKGLSDLGYKFMSTRPSVKRYGYHLKARNAHNAHANGDRWVTRSDPTRHKNRFFEGEDEDHEDDWVSQLGAQYMSRKKMYDEHGPASNYGALYSERNYILERDNELDNSWIADFGSQWMRRRRRMRGQQLSAARRVGDDAWVCEVGYQWMSRSREREASNQAWLSNLGSRYMNRQNQQEDEWIREPGSNDVSKRLKLMKDGSANEIGSQWETRRRLDYSEFGSQLHGDRAENGHGFNLGEDAHLAEPEPEDKDVADFSDGFQVLESNPVEDPDPALYVDLESSSSSS